MDILELAGDSFRQGAKIGLILGAGLAGAILFFVSVFLVGAALVRSFDGSSRLIYRLVHKVSTGGARARIFPIVYAGAGILTSAVALGELAFGRWEWAMLFGFLGCVWLLMAIVNPFGR